jgi:hypothetical protein
MATNITGGEKYKWVVIMGDGRLFVSGKQWVDCQADWDEYPTNQEQRNALIEWGKSQPDNNILTEVFNEIHDDLMAMFK